MSEIYQRYVNDLNGIMQGDYLQMSCESFKKMRGQVQCLTENVAEAGRQDFERHAHTFEEEHEDFTVVLMHKDESTNRD